MNDDLKKYIEVTGSSKEIEELETDESALEGTEEVAVDEEEMSIFPDSDDTGLGETDSIKKPTNMSLFLILIALLGVIVFLIFLITENVRLHNSDSVIDTTTVSENMEVTSEPDSLIEEDIKVDPYAGMYKSVDRNVWGLYEGVVGQLKITGVDLDYLVFQGEDNEEYLYVNEFGKADKHGCIFGDYRNNFDNLDENNVIYGHNMADGSMFAKLLQLRDNAYFSENEDFFIYFNSEGYNNIFKIFSVYETDLKSFNYIQTGFEGDTKAEFMQTVRERNEVSCLNPQEVPDNAKILTLSTCTQQGTHRLVVQAYLIAREVV